MLDTNDMLSGKDSEQMVDEPLTEDGDEWFDAQEEHCFDCKEWSVPEQKSTTSPYEEAGMLSVSRMMTG